MDKYYESQNPSQIAKIAHLVKESVAAVKSSDKTSAPPTTYRLNASAIAFDERGLAEVPMTRLSWASAPSIHDLRRDPYWISNSAWTDTTRYFHPPSFTAVTLAGKPISTPDAARDRASCAISLQHVQPVYTPP